MQLLAWLAALALLLAGAILPALSWARRQPEGHGLKAGVSYRLFLTFVGIYLPFFVYFFSPIAVSPEWKGTALFGWPSLIPATDWAWMPAVIWACVALYVSECHGRAIGAAWVTLGLLSGTLASTFISAVLLAHLVVDKLPGDFAPNGWQFVSIPMGTALLYGFMFWRNWSRHPIGGRPLVGTIAANFSMLIVNLAWAHRWFGMLPDTRPEGCYVVTAAARGHEQLVRPIGIAPYGDGFIKVNRQLLVLWELERHWRRHAPGSHRQTRRLYDRIGPVVACRITTRFRADIVYLAVKPLEWLAVVMIAVANRAERRSGRE